MHWTRTTRTLCASSVSGGFRTLRYNASGTRASHDEVGFGRYNGTGLVEERSNL